MGGGRFAPGQARAEAPGPGELSWWKAEGEEVGGPGHGARQAGEVEIPSWLFNGCPQGVCCGTQQALGGDQGLAAGRAGKGGGGSVALGSGGIWGTGTTQVPSLPHQMDPGPGQTVRTCQAQQDPVSADGTRKICLPAKYLIDFQSCSSRHQKLLFLPQNSPVLSQATEAPFCDVSSAIRLCVPVAGGEAAGSRPLCVGTGVPCPCQGSRQAGRQQAGCGQGGVS